jgi:ribosomal protein S18 acetylase RimI-like enzyme
VPIRLAEPADVPAVERIVESAYARWVGPVGRRPGPMDDDYAAEVANGRVHVLEDDDRVVGLIVLLEADDHLLVQNIAVAPGCQGQGCGRELLAFAEAEAERAGVPEMRLYTHEKMDTNIAWYLRNGWALQSRAEQDRFRRVFFAKRVGLVS